MHLAHHGIKGQKWGVRRYQNSDGTLTALGKQHYGRELRREASKAIKSNSKDAFVKKSRDFMDKYGSASYREIANSGLESNMNRLLSNVNIYTKTPIQNLMNKTSYDWDYDQTPYNPKAKSLTGRYPGAETQNAKLENDIVDKSIDWYWGKPKSEQAKKWYKENKKIIDQYGYGREYRDHKKKLLSVVLNDLDVKDTPKAREVIEPYVFWD